MNFEKVVKELNPISPYFPEYVEWLCFNDNPLIKEKYKIFLSTIIRIEEDGVWYKVHCVESGFGKDVYKYFLLSCYRIQHLYMITGSEEVDHIQISEAERLKKQLTASGHKN